MSRRRRADHGAEEIHENEERWLLTYSDMITLLLALFIVLFAISSINQKKFLALALGLKQTFDPKPGVLPNSNGVLKEASLTQTVGDKLNPLYRGPSSTTTTTVPGHATITTTASSDLQALEQRIQSALHAAGLQADVSLQTTRRGVVVQILADKVFFATGSADLGPVGDRIVDTVASVLRNDTHDIDVEGYTDNQPVTGGYYSSNEELSAVRAVNVVLRLEDTDGIAASRLSATGYGDTHPLAPNTTPQNMALNRRIDIVILSAGQPQP